MANGFSTVNKKKTLLYTVWSNRDINIFTTELSNKFK